MEKTIKELLDFVSNEFRSISKNKIDSILVIGSIILGIFLEWEGMEIMIFAIFVASILRSIPSRYFAIPALFFLVCIPFLLIFEKNDRAEELAVYAYYFLAMSAIVAIRETRKMENGTSSSG